MTRLIPTFALAAGLALAGCDTGPDSEAYDKIEEGMNRDQVHELLGAPREVVGGEAEGSYTELWHYGDQTVAVQYVEGEVALKTIETIGSDHPATAPPRLGDEEPAETENLDHATERPSGTPPRREAPDAGAGRENDERPAAEFP